MIVDRDSRGFNDIAWGHPQPLLRRPISGHISVENKVFIRKLRFSHV